MRSSLLYSAAAVASIAAAAPASKREFSPNNVYYPLANGFPFASNITPQIQKDAHGTLPNTADPTMMSPDGITNLKLLALNELFEVAFFTELVYNLTNKVSGYDLGYGHEYVLDALTSIVAQEELHLLNANNALMHFGVERIVPCKYSFPVVNFQSAIALAATFTDLMIGMLQDVNVIFAQAKDMPQLRSISAIIGNEAAQEGFFRLVQKKRPSAQAFLTAGTRDFAFSAIQSFTLNGSCPNIETIPLQTFKPLTVETTGITNTTTSIKFSYADAGQGEPKLNADDLRLAYINGQNRPIIEPLTKVTVNGGKVFFEAAFPYADNLMSGLTIAAVMNAPNSTSHCSDANAVARATIFGPGLIEVD